MKKKITLHLGGSLARMVKQAAETRGLSKSACLHLLIEQGLEASALSYVYDIEGEVVGVHGMHNLMPTEPEGRLCMYIEEALLKRLMTCGQRFSELRDASLSSKVRCLVYAGVQA